MQAGNIGAGHGVQLRRAYVWERKAPQIVGIERLCPRFDVGRPAGLLKECLAELRDCWHVTTRLMVWNGPATDSI